VAFKYGCQLWVLWIVEEEYRLVSWSTFTTVADQAAKEGDLRDQKEADEFSIPATVMVHFAGMAQGI